MVKDVIKESERKSSFKNEPSDEKYMVQEDQEGNPLEKESSSNKSNEVHLDHAIGEPCKYFSFSVSDYKNDPCSLPDMSDSERLEEDESVKEPLENEEEVIAEVEWEGELICALDELRKEKKENELLKEKLHCIEKSC